MKQIGVLLVEDHAIVRQGLRLILEREEDITVVGETSNGEDAYRIAKELRPNVAVMDIGLPGTNGIETTKRIRTELPETHVIALTMHLENEYVFAMLKAGAEGYLAKDSIAAELVNAVRAVNNGQSILCPGATRKLIEEVNHSYAPSAQSEVVLTKREEDILRLLATGATSKEIGNKLHISSKTVDNYRSAIVAKLSARNKTEAIMYAVKLGLIPATNSAA